MTIRRYHHTGVDYLILGLMLLICFLTYLKISGEVDKQLQVGLITAMGYAIWGVFHHLHEGDLHWKIVLEYSVLALFSFSSLWFLLMVLT